MAFKVFKQVCERLFPHAFLSGGLPAKAYALPQAKALHLCLGLLVEAIAFVLGHGHHVIRIDNGAVVEQVVFLDDSRAAGDAQKVVVL